MAAAVAAPALSSGAPQVPLKAAAKAATPPARLALPGVAPGTMLMRMHSSQSGIQHCSHAYPRTSLYCLPYDLVASASTM
ncbi:hypothetical protein D9Q98_000657 [Chlorella vulgaris]|uniref:Uncharacterized protein n=1 Tax=Chlorella vulgaris TaxID=3077 RepID=A0A9D4Z1V1_CHLVU|nr:hypothetical protein D9Q98_000657 [Chlorella vulgaris]